MVYFGFLLGDIVQVLNKVQMDECPIQKKKSLKLNML